MAAGSAPGAEQSPDPAPTAKPWDGKPWAARKWINADLDAKFSAMEPNDAAWAVTAYQRWLEVDCPKHVEDKLVARGVIKAPSAPKETCDSAIKLAARLNEEYPGFKVTKVKVNQWIHGRGLKRKDCPPLPKPTVAGRFDWESSRKWFVEHIVGGGGAAARPRGGADNDLENMDPAELARVTKADNAIIVRMERLELQGALVRKDLIRPMIVGLAAQTAKLYDALMEDRSGLPGIAAALARECFPGQPEERFVTFAAAVAERFIAEHSKVKREVGERARKLEGQIPKARGQDGG